MINFVWCIWYSEDLTSWRGALDTEDWLIAKAQEGEQWCRQPLFKPGQDCLEASARPPMTSSVEWRSSNACIHVQADPTATKEWQAPAHASDISQKEQDFTQLQGLQNEVARAKFCQHMKSTRHLQALKYLGYETPLQATHMPFTLANSTDDPYYK